MGYEFDRIGHGWFYGQLSLAKPCYNAALLPAVPFMKLISIPANPVPDELSPAL